MLDVVRVLGSYISPGYLEIGGMILVLLSAFFKLSLLDAVGSIARENSQYVIERKLDDIFKVVTQHYRDNYPSSSKKVSVTAIDSLEDHWPLAGKEYRISMQHATMNRIYNWGFMLGSLLLVLAKVFSFAGS